jgi:hypothetical protein
MKNEKLLRELRDDIVNAINDFSKDKKFQIYPIIYQTLSQLLVQVINEMIIEKIIPEDRRYEFIDDTINFIKKHSIKEKMN